MFDIGDEVYWNDPDDGLSSGVYKIIRVTSENTVYISNDTSEAEVYIHELS